ncbi:L-histidine N(alpha)-methyltransferase [Methyloceanibacter sp.]|uniref:L-histidine N(alpha)-methyltransferase n=1 Tax=Methyloceanibacter sp. TaxID=1965321 RepID=UPI002D323C2F|nr:L-histidine N(alpha)-methyltransferase [Methyloceanibacter sp.]HZP08402.1 L-histidine N(alpha)-methyltransferase [Methyloceanibacter sp.]
MMEGDITFELPDGVTVSLESARARRAPEADEFARAVLAGLASRPREIPCRFFYDAVGSELFEEIAKLDEYYPTRVEAGLLEAHREEIAELAGPSRVLIEFGSGSSRKTSLLIGALESIPAYVPIDIASESLKEAAGWLLRQHPGLTIMPLISDFTRTRALPLLARGRRKLGFFSGSTIGNLTHDEARAFLANAARLLGKGSLFLIGVDLKKSLSVLLPAYNDAKGVTAAFNLNLLARINRELGGDFDLSRFAHEAVYNERHGRIEMYLVSLVRQTARVLGNPFAFAEGERIHTENSHKYTVGEFQALASRAGWQPVKAWVDPEQLFSLHLLRL